MCDVIYGRPHTEILVATYIAAASKVSCVHTKRCLNPKQDLGSNLAFNVSFAMVCFFITLFLYSNV